MHRQGSAPPWEGSSQVLPLTLLLLASESPSTWGGKAEAPLLFHRHPGAAVPGLPHLALLLHP